MGIYSRDYLREDYGAHGTWRSVNVVKWLIIVNVVVFILQVVTRNVLVDVVHAGITYKVAIIERWCALDQSAIFSAQIWRLLTYEFLHDSEDLGHLFFNMLGLYFAGRKVEAYYGSREFLLFYLAAGILSGLFSVLWYESFSEGPWSAIGASGAVAAVFIVYALHWPFDVWRIMGIIPVQAMWLAIFYVAYDVYPLLLQIGGVTPPGNVAHCAHFGGMLFAFVYQRKNLRLEPLLSGFRPADWKKRLRPKAKLRVFHPEVETDFEERVDELLKKVQEEGEASLTDAERAMLIEASRRYRNRNR